LLEALREVVQFPLGALQFEIGVQTFTEAVSWKIRLRLGPELSVAALWDR
jgi:hypothetical protein